MFNGLSGPWLAHMCVCVASGYQPIGLILGQETGSRGLWSRLLSGTVDWLSVSLS